MPIVEGIEGWRGQDVLDSAGEKAGRLEEVFYDAAGQKAVLISIKRGRLGHHVKLAPLSDAAASRDYVRLPFSGEQIAGSPDVTVGDELTAEQCAAVCALFAVSSPSRTSLSSGPRSCVPDRAGSARCSLVRAPAAAAPRRSDPE